MKKLKIIFILGFISFTVLLACKKEQPSMQNAEDPCACASEVSADFDILERHNIKTDFFTKTDAVLRDRQVHFKAKEEDAEYTWYIGIDIEETKDTWKFFDQQWIGYTIPITLVVKKNPNTKCFPNDNGYDSITKTFTIYDRCDTNILEGSFRVAQKNSTDSFDIKLNFREAFAAPDVPSTSGLCRGLDIYNYDGKGSNCIDMDLRMFRNFRAFVFGAYYSSQGSKSLCDYIHFDNCELNLENNVFTISYYTLPEGTTESVERYNLRGRKI